MTSSDFPKFCSLRTENTNVVVRKLDLTCKKGRPSHDSHILTGPTGGVTCVILRYSFVTPFKRRQVSVLRNLHMTGAANFAVGNLSIIMLLSEILAWA